VKSFYNAEGKVLNPDSDAARHFSYVRYNADLSEEGLIEMGLEHIVSDVVREMDSVKNIKDLHKVGRTAGKKMVKVKEHFHSFTGH
jgi:uncharacterized protein